MSATARSVLAALSFVTVGESASDCICESIRDPVCGHDGKTYSNACEADCYAGGYEYEGECASDCLCQTIWDPVCGYDGKTYSNACEADCHAGGHDYEGECERDCVCPEIWDPVCGYGGMTYPNSCEADCYAGGYEYEGECAATSPTPAPCADDDAGIIAWAGGVGFTISGCSDLQSVCEHAAYGSTVQATCPATCGSCTAEPKPSPTPPPCADDDARIIAQATRAGFTISGCSDVQPFCEHAAYGSTVQATCPATCGSCKAPFRRLADGNDHNVDELDRIEELTVPALAAKVRQRIEELSRSDTNIFYP